MLACYVVAALSLEATKMRKSALIFSAGIVVGLAGAYIGHLALNSETEHQPAPISDNRPNQAIGHNTIIQQSPSNAHSLPHSRWPQEWLRAEAFMDASQTCQAKIKTKTFNPDTIHWVQKFGEHPTQSYYEQKHVIVWYFDTRNDYGVKLYWTGVCNFDLRGKLEDFDEVNRTYTPQIDDKN